MDLGEVANRISSTFQALPSFKSPQGFGQFNVGIPGAPPSGFSLPGDAGFGPQLPGPSGFGAPGLGFLGGLKAALPGFASPGALSLAQSSSCFQLAPDGT